MRRQDIQLLVAARHGDIAARCEVGRRYITGTDGFPRHVGTALDYLTHPSVTSHPAALAAISTGLTLAELLIWDQLPALSRAAEQSIDGAALKLGAWELLSPSSAEQGQRRLRQSAVGVEPTQTAQTSSESRANFQASDAAALLVGLAANGLTLEAEVFAVALRRANSRQSTRDAIWVLEAGRHWLERDLRSVASDILDTVDVAERCGVKLETANSRLIEAAIGYSADQGDARASYIQGRALAGIRCGALEPRALVRVGNVRKGTALLLRAADAGNVDAWMHLFHLSSDRRRTVANPQMARFFLEKAAHHGHPKAQRMVGALLLRETESVQGSERALHWLHLSDQQGDPLARRLMSSLVLPVGGDDETAQELLAAIRQSDPLLAARLSVARCLGLTRLEALGVDLVSGTRPWGLVVGPNPAVRQRRLAAARAVPALSADAFRTLHRAAALHAGHAGSRQLEGNLHQRARSLRTLLERLGAEDTAFFANASSTTLDTLRIGAKWARRARDVLRQALSDSR